MEDFSKIDKAVLCYFRLIKTTPWIFAIATNLEIKKSFIENLTNVCFSVAESDHATNVVVAILLQFQINSSKKLIILWFLSA